MIITKREFEQIKKHKPGERFNLKLDFGLTLVSVLRGDSQAIINDNISLKLDEKIKDKFCYILDDQEVRKIDFFSDSTNRYYKLTPTPDWPTFSISSVPMHKLSSPKADTEAKISLIKPFGVVLDTCMGPGYTAILASKKAKKIITFEKDLNIITLAQANPISAPLFKADNIEISYGDVFQEIKALKSNYFDCIIHDPPTLKMAPLLFSSDFYLSLKRVLKDRGRFFHYTPLYKIKQGYDFPAKVKVKLKKAGFKNIDYSSRAGGFLCQK